MSGASAGERRWDRGSISVLMAEANGWVMVRRPGCIPYTMPLSEWRERALAQRK